MAPLKKIVEWLRVDTSFMGKSKVRLECGHVVSTAATYSARCQWCHHIEVTAKTITNQRHLP